MISIEAAKDLKLAKTLAKELSRCNEGEFVVFDQRIQQTVASFRRP
jgi:hypothetical protein